jgi:hypothetical protein
MSRLTCAVCGSSDVTKTAETESGLVALCDFHYSFVLDEAKKVEASENAARRMKAREVGS